MVCDAYKGEGFTEEGECTKLSMKFKKGMQRPCEHVQNPENCPLVIMRG